MRLFRLSLVAAVLLVSAVELGAQTTMSSRGASIRLGGRLHTQYATSSVDAYDEHVFFRRARLIADITVNDFLDARVQPEFAGSSAELKDAYVRLRFSPAFQVTFGQFKRPFDLFELASSTDLSLIERDGRVGGAGGCAGVGGICSFSRLTQKLQFADRDTGLRVGGASGKVSYEVAVTNGAGANVADENDAKSFSGRLTVAVSEKLAVGAQLAAHDYVDGNDETAYGNAWSADVQYGGWRDGLLFQAALVGGDNWKKIDGAGDPAEFLALQGVASYYHALEGGRWSGVEPLVRLSYGDPDTTVDSDGGLVFTPGVMLYVLGRNKIGINLDVWSPQSGDAEYSLKLQSFLYF